MKYFYRSLLVFGLIFTLGVPGVSLAANPVVKTFTATLGARGTGIVGQNQGNFPWQEVTLDWTSTGATHCVGFGTGPFENIPGRVGWLGDHGTSGSVTVRIYDNATFEVACAVGLTDLTPTTRRSVSVTMDKSAIVGPDFTFTATPSTGVKVGDLISVNWASSNANTCTGAGDLSFGLYGNSVKDSKTQVINGSKTLIAVYAGNYNISMTCTGASGGTSTKTLPISIAPAAPNTGSSNPNSLGVNIQGPFGEGPFTLRAGTSLPINWSVTPAAEASQIFCTASGLGDLAGWSGNLPSVGSFTGSPTLPTRYTISCKKNGTGVEVMDSVIVNVVNVSGVSSPVNPVSPVSPGTVNPSNPVNPTSPANPVSSGAGSPSCDAVFSTNLSFGSRGTEVLRLQRFLVAQGLLDEESTSGYFGPLTRGAVQQFQSSRNIARAGDAGYGQMGPLTRAAMNASCGNSSGATGATGGQSSGTTNPSGQNVGGNDDKRVDLTASSLGNNTYRLAWTSVGVTSCTSNDFYIPTSGVSTSGSATVTTATAKTYAISCVKSTGVEEDTVTVGGNTPINNSSGTNQSSGGTSTNTGASGDRPDLTSGAPTTTTAKTNTEVRLFAPFTNGPIQINSPSRSFAVLFYYFFQVASAPEGAGTIVNVAPDVVGGELIEANRTLVANSRYTFRAPGTYSIRICADNTAPGSGSMIVESNENNNCGPWGNVVVTN